MNKIFLDNIVFSLQKSGGISVLWSELIKKITHSNYDVTYLEYNNALQNLFRKKIVLKSQSIFKHENVSYKIERYRNPTINCKEDFIFCSSYYRTCKNKNAINVTIVHDFTYEYYGKGIAKWAHYFQKKRAIEKSDGIICISENTKNDLLKFHPHIDKDKIRVIHNGVSDDFFKIKGDIDLKSFDDRFTDFAQKKILIFIGHRTSYKNFDKAVLAYSQLDPENGFHFVIVGEELNEKEIKLLQQNLLPNSYTVLNGIDNNKLNALYNKAFALIYPSSYEGFGIPLIEAMKTGLPVIASKNSSLIEIGGDAAILLNILSPQNIAEEINKLLDISYRNNLIEKGFLQSSKFSWNKTMNLYMDYFYYLLEKNKRQKMSYK